MNHFIELYHKEFKIAREEAVNSILKELKAGKNLTYKFNHISNNIIKEGSKYRENLFIKNKPFHILLSIFNDRCAIFEDEHQYEVIPNILKPEFEKIKTEAKDKELTFVDCISNLAKHEAHFTVYNLFRNNNVIYDFMYRLDKFEGYNNMTKFNVVHYNRTTEGTPIYKELRPLIYPIENISPPLTNNSGDEKKGEPNLYKNDIKKPKFTNFIIIKRYEPAFKHEDIYAHLTDYYINPELTSFDYFKEVFVSNSKSDSYIQFICTTQLASLLLFNFKNEFFTNLTFTNIGLSKKFKTADGGYLTRSNLSNSKINANEKDYKQVEETINFIKSIEINVKKPLHVNDM